MLAGVRNKSVAADESPILKVRLAYSAAVPIPKPAARLPNDIILLTREAGTVRCLADELS